MEPATLPDRTVIAITGTDARNFLQGIITSDMQSLSPQRPLYALLLSPQGKLLFEFFLFERGGVILADIATTQAETFIKRLSLYKLRADVRFAIADDWRVVIDDVAMPADPRLSDLGHRGLVTAGNAPKPAIDESYRCRRLTLGIAEQSEWVPDRSFPMEFGYGHLNAISYSKGCYIGQEIVARARTRGTLNKAVHIVSSESPLPSQGDIVEAERTVGSLLASDGCTGMALLRFAPESSPYTALTIGGQPVSISMPTWFSRPQPAIA